MNRVFEYEWLLYKKCNNCNVTKEVKDFKSNWYNKNRVKLYKPYCWYCWNIMQRNLKILDKERHNKQKERMREWRRANKDKTREYSRTYYKSLNKEEYRKLLKKNRKNYKIRKNNESNTSMKEARG